MKYIATASKESCNLGVIKRVLRAVDTKRSVVGEEIGSAGFRHFQLCIDCSGDLENYSRNNNLGWHIEPCISWSRSLAYCRKEGHYHDYGFNDRRFLIEHFREDQRTVIEHLNNQGDRTITVWINPSGSIGKTSMLYNLARVGKILPIPRTDKAPHRIMDFCAMMYEDEDIICLDLPRNDVLTKDQAGTLESIKDGLLVS